MRAYFPSYLPQRPAYSADHGLDSAMRVIEAMHVIASAIVIAIAIGMPQSLTQPEVQPWSSIVRAIVKP